MDSLWCWLANGNGLAAGRGSSQMAAGDRKSNESGRAIHDFLGLLGGLCCLFVVVFRWFPVLDT